MLELILDGTSVEARTLQDQAAVVEVVQRSAPGGSGAWIWFEVPEHAPRLKPQLSARVTNLEARIVDRDGRELPAWFILHIKAGRLAVLEAVAPQGPWPEHPQLVAWYYTNRRIDGMALEED